MTNAPTAAGDALPAPRTSRVARHIARATLRMGNYPGRSFVGTLVRRRGRQIGERSFYVDSHDGTRLAAWYAPAAEGVPRRLPVVLSHGWCEVKEVHLPRARRLNRLGHDVVLFDHRSHGRSRGRHVTFGVHERRDVAAVADAARDRGIIEERFITVGFSLGAATVLQHAAIDPRVAGVVAFAPFVDFRQAIRSFRSSLAPWMGEAWLLRGFEQTTRDHGFELDEATTLEAMTGIHQPVLLIEGGRDRNLPPDRHTQMLLPAKTQGRIEVVRIERASHRTICHRCWPDLDAKIATFCSEL